MRVRLVSKVASPVFYDRMMHECYRGGLKSPRIVQEGMNEATILSLVSSGLGVGWVLGTARWRCPETVVVLPVADLNMPLTLALAWRRDNTSPFARKLMTDVRRLPDVRAVIDEARWCRVRPPGTLAKRHTVQRGETAMSTAYRPC